MNQGHEISHLHQAQASYPEQSRGTVQPLQCVGQPSS